MNHAIDRLLVGADLSKKEATRAFEQVFTESGYLHAYPLLTLLQKKGETSTELSALASLIRRKEGKIKLSSAPYIVDGCGTGGDGAHTFNISTLACLVAAGAGAQVAKHGNRSVTSRSGSSDLLERLHVKIDAPLNRMQKAFKTCGFAYFHAPLYHPSFKSIAPIRGCLGKKRIKTIFNLTGPLVNPAAPQHQLIGVFRKDLGPLIAQAAKNIGLKHAIIVWNFGGLDELHPSTPSLVWQLKDGKLKQFLFSPKSLGLRSVSPSQLKGGAPAKNAQIARSILSRKDRSPRVDIILLNAAAILVASGRASSMSEGLRLARQSVESGKALQVLETLAKVSRGA